MSAILTTSLSLPLQARGKVRDTYRLDGGELLMVATDRLSAFDVVLPTPIPEKGRVLNQLSLSWFTQTEGIVRNHVAPDQRIPEELRRQLPDLPERGMRVVAAEPIMFECVVRGYISGSGWKDYQRSGTIAGERLPGGLDASWRQRSSGSASSSTALVTSVRSRPASSSPTPSSSSAASTARSSSSTR